MRTYRPLALLVLPWLTAAPAVAQSVETLARKQATAMLAASGAVRVDGRLNEEVWALAKPVTDFLQAEPVEGAPPDDPMEVRLVYNDDALFVGARMFSRNPADIQAPMSRRDEGTAQAEHIFVSLDTYLDRRTAYTFGVTAAGVRFDHYHPNDNRSSRDSGFDPVWEARVTVDEEGWIAEMRIPFNQLRFITSEAPVWGLNIYRAVPSRNEEVYWSLVRRTERVWASQFGDLHGISGIRSARRVELLPYLASASTIVGSPDPDNPFDDGGNLEGRVGVDAKMGLGPNLTLEAALNPDFGQVEADPAEVNLSAFETFFDERRSFFLEGSRLLGGEDVGPAWEGGGTGQYFYSRRIGAAPVGTASGDFVDYPRTSTILGAGKITGRLSSGTSVGILSAITASESARTFDLGTASLGRARVAPTTAFTVGRIQQEFGSSGSTVAFMVTSTNRDVAPDEPLASLVARNAFTASGESLLRFKGGEYEVGMNLGVSRVSGDAAAIARIQRSSARYLQRPDADYVLYDPTRTSMGGMKAGVSAERTSGRHWLWEASVDFISPEFEVNDLGRLSTADLLSTSAELQYRETSPGRLFRSWAVGVEQEREWSVSGELQDASVGAEADVTWPNFWTTDVSVDFDLPAQDLRLSRGGPTMGTPPGWSANLGLGNSRASGTRVNARAGYSQNEDGGFAFDMSTGITLRPAPQWQLSFQPGYERQVNDQQYVATVDGGPAATFGHRYVFAFVDRSTISSEIRLNYAFRPDVTVEFYGEPFAASGRYYDFGELVAAGGRARRTYQLSGLQYQPNGTVLVTDAADQFSFRNRDFNVLSFRSNLVLRWEWRPGSLLYVVWQQDREESTLQSDRVRVGDLFSSFGASGNNVLAVKTTFWLGS
jgi:hypothetical protein